MSTALIVIDLQRWFLETGHREKIAQVPRLIAGVNELLDLFHKRGLPVIRVRMAHSPDGSTRNLWMKRNDRWTLTEGSSDVEAYEGIRSARTDTVVTKTRTSAFVRTDLESLLQGMGVNKLVIAGFSIDLCVGLTAIDAFERDFDLTLAGDAILACNPSDGERMLTYLRDKFGFEPASNAAIAERIASESPCGL